MATVDDSVVGQATTEPAPAGNGTTTSPEVAPGIAGSPTRDVVRGGANLYGACSIENFCDAGSLSQTHEDAGGFLAYVRQFNAENFWFGDGAVKAWQYTEPYDDWQDTYGVDAVRAFYHSGHGGMDANGVFYVPLGAAWAGNDCTVRSDQMQLGNERLRYIFWSTCLSCRVLDGHSPIRTWHGANRGLRMLFGFETVSVDDPSYGSRFWGHWRAGKSFSQAWMDASWDISNYQAPAVVATGATAAEAQDRLFNERFFSGAAGSRAYYWWRWYYSRAARAPREALPDNLLVARLAPPTARSIRGLTDRFGFDASGLRMNGAAELSDGPRSLHVDRDTGTVTAILAKPNLENPNPLPVHEVRARGEAALARFGLDEDAPLVFDRIVDVNEAGASSDGASEVDAPTTRSRIVQFRQVINDLPVLTPGAGVVRIAIDNDGAVTEVVSSTRPVERMSRRGRVTVEEPPPPGRAPEGGARYTPGDPEQLLATRFSEQLVRMASSGSGIPLSFAPVPGSFEIGYDLRGADAIVVAQREVEADFGNGFRRRYRVTAPLFG